jgi:DNA excision repair protein ERCC-3
MAPLIVQHDGELILATEASGAASVADGLRRFATLEKCPGHFHHYRITRQALWQAAAAGITPARIRAFLERASGAPLPEALVRRIAATMARHGRLRLVRADGLLWLRSDDPDILARLLPNLGEEFAIDPSALGANGLPLRPSQRGAIGARLARLGWPLRDEAGYAPGAPLAVAWRDGLELRPYQHAAIAAFVGDEGRDRGSGLVLLPCGAGKTLVGLGALIALARHTLILCPNRTAVAQWLEACARFTTLATESYGPYDARRMMPLPVTVTTYQQLTTRRRRSTSAGGEFPHLERLGSYDWGLIVFDEAHLLPADIFRLTAELAARRRLGLTATPVREDGREDELTALIGPILYDAPWTQLAAEGWIAPVECVEVRVPLGATDGPLSHRAAATAPEKWATVRRLVRRHAGEGTLIIGHYLEQLRDLAVRLDAPLVSGETPQDVREALFARFRAGEVRLLLLSRVGNAALDLPEARVAIEVSGNFGSRQEEAQRLGRLLRPKADGAPAHFYAVVADDPAESAHAARRQRFLVQQGYRYRIARVAQSACPLPPDAMHRASRVRYHSAAAHRREAVKGAGAYSDAAAKRSDDESAGSLRR